MLRRVLTFLQSDRKPTPVPPADKTPVAWSAHEGPPPLDPDFPEVDEDKDPYKSHGWAGTKWFCIRCGGLLESLPESDDKGWTWRVMRTKGYLLFRCSNSECVHHSGYLTLHHPHSTERGPGESYSISWIR
jgi:hypothetical protein